MAWGKSDDTTAFHHRLLRLWTPKDERLLNEAWGFTHRAFCWSAGAYLDGFVPESLAHQLAPGRHPALVKAAQRAGLLGPRVAKHPESGDPGWHLILDVDELLHLRTKAEVEAERAYRRQLANPSEFLPVRRRDGDHCRYCSAVVVWKDTKGGRGGTLDHVIPGGTDLVVACRRCNGLKQDRTPEQAGLTLNPPPEAPFYTDHTRKLLEAHGYLTSTTVAHHPPGGDAAGSDVELSRTQLEVETQQTLSRTTPRETQQQEPLQRTGTAGDRAPASQDQPRTSHGPPGPGVQDQARPGRAGSGRDGHLTPSPDVPAVPPPPRNPGRSGRRGRRKPPSAEGHL